MSGFPHYTTDKMFSLLKRTKGTHVRKFPNKAQRDATYWRVRPKYGFRTYRFTKNGDYFFVTPA